MEMTERQKLFKERLLSELNDPELWYYPKKNLFIDTYVIDKKCPYASSTGRVVDYRHIWWLNYPNDIIEYNEMIHHKNGCHHDNRIENLEKVKKLQHPKKHIELNKSKWKPNF